MSFTPEQLQAALEAQMGGFGVKKGFGFKAGAKKAASAMGGMFPASNAKVAKNVAKLEENDAQAMALNLLILERLEEYGIDLGITNIDIHERQQVILEDYRDRKVTDKKAAKEEKKAERLARAQAFKERVFGGAQAAPEVFNQEADGGRSGFDEVSEEETVVPSETSYVFKGVPDEDEE